MDKTEFDNLMNKYLFYKEGEIVDSNHILGFQLTRKTNLRGYVYLWVEHCNSEYIIRYVGKAGKTLAQRCAEHKAGFKQSASGIKNAVLLRAGFARGCRYYLYARKSPQVNLCDETDIPNECAEELAFIKKFSATIWNRARSSLP